MRIISSFRDYYDCVQSLGQNQGLVYLRESREEQLTEPLLDLRAITDHMPAYYSKFILATYVIGFCGRAVPMLHVSNSQQHAYCYSADEVRAFVEQHYKPKMVRAYLETTSRNWWYSLWRDTGHASVVDFFSAFKAAKKLNDVVRQHCEKQRSPVFLCRQSNRRHSVTWNASLRDVQFQRIVDPYTAYQEIAMFLGALAAPEKPLPQVPDKTLAEAKGFDQFSFRKPKQ